MENERLQHSSTERIVGDLEQPPPFVPERATQPDIHSLAIKRIGGHFQTALSVLLVNERISNIFLR